MHILPDITMCMHVYMNVYVCSYTCMAVFMYTCMCVYMYVCIHVYLYVLICMCMYLNISYYVDNIMSVLSESCFKQVWSVIIKLGLIGCLLVVHDQW